MAAGDPVNLMASFVVGQRVARAMVGRRLRLPRTLRETLLGHDIPLASAGATSLQTPLAGRYRCFSTLVALTQALVFARA